MRPARNALIVLLAALLSVPAMAQDFSGGLLDRDAVILSGQAVTVEAYPNADDVLVDDHIRVDYQSDGTSVRWDDTVMKVLSEAGKRNYQSLSFYYMLPYSTAEATLVEVIKPDGTVVPVDIEAQSAVMADPSMMAMNIFNPNDKVLTVGVPDLEVGDMVRYVFVRRTVKTRIPDAWHDYELLEYTSPIKHFVYEVFGPEELPIRQMMLKDEVAGTVTHTTDTVDGRVHHRWEVADVPRMYLEPDMPPRVNVSQRIKLSTIPDWQTISRWCWSINEPHIQQTTPEMEAKVVELTDGLTDRQERIEAIFFWVTQKVRYMGITTETTAPGYEPHDVSITFGNKYGVCRDKAALLTAMLRLDGFEANVVLIHTGAKRDVEVPDPYFNHAIVAVREEDGSWQLMDCTSETTSELLPSYLCNKSYLVATEAGEDLATSPIIPAEQNNLSIESRGAVNASGGLTLETEMRFVGYDDTNYRGYFVQIKPEERRQFFEMRVKNLIPGASIDQFEMWPADLQDTSKPFVVRMTISADDFLVAGEQCSTMRPPFFSGGVGTVNFLLRGGTGLEEREYPLQTNIACGVSETFTLDLPAGLGDGATMPPFEAIDEETVTWRKSLSLDDSTLTGTAEFSLNVVQFTPAEYQLLRGYLQAIEYNQRKMPILAGMAQADEADALVSDDDDYIILERRVVYDVADAHNWTERRTMRKKILTPAGREANAELMFTYNTAWESVELLSATVTAPDGTVKQVSEEEINLMDAGWVSGAPRYPAAKQLVVNLPNVDVGSVIEYEIQRTCTDRPFFSASESFRVADPVVSKTVDLRVPADLPLTIFPVNADDLELVEASAGARAFRVWTIANQTGFKLERMLPPVWTWMPYLIISAGDWSDYAAQVGEALDTAASNADEAAAKAAELIDGLETDEAKVLAIRNFVASSIRLADGGYYFEPQLHELPLSAITAADRVLADGYGNSADRAVLLAAMLRAVGFEPKFVLVLDGPIPPELNEALRTCPETSSLSEVMIRVECDGQEVYLNDLNQYAAFGSTYHDQELGLDVETGEFVTIAATADRQDVEDVRFSFRLDAEGNAAIEKTVRHHGYHFADYHQFFSEMTPEERRRHHLEMIADIAQGARADGELETDFDGHPGLERFAVTVDSYAVRDGDHMVLSLPANFIGVRLPGTDTREADVYWAYQDKTIGQIVVELPEEFTTVLLAPESFQWQAPADAGSVTCAVSQEASPPRLVVEYDIDLKPAVIPAGEYDKLLEIQRLLTRPAARTIILRKSE